MISLQTRTISERDAHDWLWNNNNRGSIFCTPRWDAFLHKTYQAKKHFIGIYDQSELICLWPAYMVRKGPFRILGSPLRGWFTPWMDPVFSSDIPDSDRESIRRQALTAFDRYGDEKRFDYVECASRLTTDSVMKALDYQPMQKATAILDISPEPETLLKTFSKTCRKRIKRACKYGCTVKDISSLDFVPELWQMTLDVYGRKGIGPAHNPHIIKCILETHMKSGHLFCLGVFRKEKLIAIGVQARHQTKMIDLFRATYRDCYNYFPYYLMYWHLFELAREKGVRHFNMMGVDPQNPDQFKMSFHPQLVHWNHWVKSRTLRGRAGSMLYEFFVEKIVRNRTRMKSRSLK